jgi:plasmid stabilization system protein ParE
VNRPVRFHGFAELELEEASDYYGRATPGLQEAFLAEVERGCRLLSEFPEVGALVRQGVRKLVLKRFPYSLFYTVREDGVRIVAIGHQHRRPFYWRRRL